MPCHREGVAGHSGLARLDCPNGHNEILSEQVERPCSAAVLRSFSDGRISIQRVVVAIIKLRNHVSAARKRCVIQWAEKIVPLMNIEQNESPSFCKFRDGVRRLVTDINRPVELNTTKKILPLANLRHARKAGSKKVPKRNAKK